MELARPLRRPVDDVDNFNGTSFLSRKVFIYTPLNNRSEALTAFRSGKHAPLRPLNPVREIFEKVTVGATLSTATANAATRRGYYAEVEFPGGRRLRADKLAIARRTGLPVAVPDLLRALLRVPADGLAALARLGEQYEVVGFVRSVRARRPVARWVSLASPGDAVGAGRSQEYYTLRGGGASPASATSGGGGGGGGGSGGGGGNDAPPGGRAVPFMGLGTRGSATLRYTRYGEGPSWHSVGRAVASEIVATRYASLADAPPHVLRLVTERCPGFFNDADGAHVGATDTGAVAKVLTLENFRRQRDAYDDFKPWYDGFLRWAKMKGSGN